MFQQLNLLPPEPHQKRMDERYTPRQRILRDGARTMTPTELLAILTGRLEVAEALLQQWPTLAELAKVDLYDLAAVHGVGVATAAKLKAAFGLSAQLMTGNGRRDIHSPEDVAELVRWEMSQLDHEELWVILLDVRNRMLGLDKLYKGTATSSNVRIGELFKSAISRKAASIILCHNHPSGDPSPSPEDIALTRAAFEAGRLLDIQVVDHLVMGGAQYVSFKERGLVFSAGK